MYDGEEGKKEETYKKKIEIFMFGFSTLLKVGGTYIVDVAIEKQRHIVFKLHRLISYCKVLEGDDGPGLESQSRLCTFLGLSDHLGVTSDMLPICTVAVLEPVVQSTCTVYASLNNCENSFQMFVLKANGTSKLYEVCI